MNNNILTTTNYVDIYKSDDYDNIKFYQLYIRTPDTISNNTLKLVAAGFWNGTSHICP